jgi:hypothetical protein
MCKFATGKVPELNAVAGQTVEARDVPRQGSGFPNVAIFRNRLQELSEYAIELLYRLSLA